MFPDVLLHHSLTTCSSAEVCHRSVFPQRRGVQETTDGRLRWLATDDHLISIRHHPDSWMMGKELAGTKGESICEFQAVGTVSM